MYTISEYFISLCLFVVVHPSLRLPTVYEFVSVLLSLSTPDSDHIDSITYSLFVSAASGLVALPFVLQYASWLYWIWVKFLTSCIIQSVSPTLPALAYTANVTCFLCVLVCNLCSPAISAICVVLLFTYPALYPLLCVSLAFFIPYCGSKTSCQQTFDYGLSCMHILLSQSPCLSCLVSQQFLPLISGLYYINYIQLLQLQMSCKLDVPSHTK